MQVNSRRKEEQRNIPITLIVPSTHNPRKNVDPSYIRELANSLRRDGQWDPIIVRKRKDSKYEIIAGECRLRAAKSAGLKTLKARILKMDNIESLVLALKTNILRKDLNPVEEGNALKELLAIEKDPESLIKTLSKSKTWISNRLKLAKASEGLQNAVLKGELPLTSAVKITELPEGFQGLVASKAIRERLNMREIEKFVDIFKEATSKSMIESLLRTPVKDYSTAPPGYGRNSMPYSKRSKPMLMKCECGALYIIDWTGCRVVSERAMDYERNNNIGNNQKILE